MWRTDKARIFRRVFVEETDGVVVFQSGGMILRLLTPDLGLLKEADKVSGKVLFVSEDAPDNL